MWYVTALGIVITWLAILIVGIFIGFRCGHRAALREMALVDEWTSFRQNRRVAFVSALEEEVGRDTQMEFHGAVIPVDEYLKGYTDATLRSLYAEPRFPRRDSVSICQRPGKRPSASI